MGTVTRVNGLDCTVDTVYSLNANAYLITVKDVGATAIDLRAEDDAVDETVEALVKELNPLMFYVTNATTGLVHVIMDKSINSAAELQVRVRRLGTAVGPNTIDVSGSTVVAATSITVGVA